MKDTNLVKKASKFKRQGKLDEAISLYQQAIESNPSFAWYYHNLGEALAKKSCWDEAIAAYQKAIELNPNIASFFIKLGEALVKQELLDQAISCIQKAIKINSSYYKSYNHLGCIWFKKENWQLAIESFQKSIELKPNSYWAYYQLAEVYLKQENFQEAAKYYREAHKLNPTSLFDFNFSNHNDAATPFQLEILEILAYSSQETKERLLGFTLDRPQTGEKFTNYRLILQGWVIGCNFDVVAIEVVNANTKVIHQNPINVARKDIAEFYQNASAENSGFRIVVDVSGLPENSELTLRSVHSDKKRVPFQLLKYKIKKSHKIIDVSSLTSLANYYKSDKGNLILNSHHYTKIYEEELKSFKKKSSKGEMTGWK